MTDTTVSDARLAEMLADAISERDCTLIGDDCCYDFYPSELVNALTELQRLRTQPVNEPAEWQVEAVAKAFDPHAFKSWQQSYDYEMGQSGNSDEAKAFADWSMGKRIEEVRTAAREALRAASLPKKPAPVVKPLEWENGVIGDGSPLRQNTWRTGHYLIVESPAGNYDLRGHRYAICATLEEAKALAQADYEQRILSALTKQEGSATHRHKKRGTKYVLIGYGKMQSEKWKQPDTNGYGEPLARSVDMREVAIYRSATDPTEIWVRPREEFEDGRFATLSDTGGEG